MKLRLLWLGLATFIVAIIAVLPVRWMAWVLPPQVQCAGWAGSVWQGQCTGLVIRQGGPAIQIDMLRWKLHAAALLRLTISADFNFRNSQGAGSGTADLGTKGRIAVRNLAVTALLDQRIATMLAPGWNGQLEGRNVAFRLQGDTLQQLSGELALHDFRDSSGAPLGSYRLSFAPAAAAPFNGRLVDIDGPLGINASVTVTADRHWQLDGRITPRPEAAPKLRSRLNMLSAAEPDGSYRFQSEGSFQ